MDYEQKYKEALERANKVHKYSSDPAEIKRMEDIFPELAESEDEKTRKALISFLKSPFVNENITDEKVAPWLAWLENQDKTKEYTFKSLPRLLDMIEPTSKVKTYCQKLIDTLIKEGYTTDAKIVGECLKQMNGENVSMAVMDEQTITDKSEPKFKIGDWVIWNNKMSCYIDNIYQGKESLMYTIIDTNNIIRSCSVKIFDNNAHLWSIKDAKDGDVLVVDNMPFIYNGSKNEVTVGAYCGFNAKHRFSFAYNYVINQNITPATKEQCDMLFQKINEAGYTFDFKKKKLKEIHVIDEGKSEIDYCFTKMMNGEKVNPIWSEEDEHHIKELESLIKQVWVIAEHENDKETIQKMSNLSFFLKTLKPQLKQEWSEEDEIKIKSIIAFLKSPSLCTMNGNKGIIDENIKYLKSIKDRVQSKPQYKPSDEQLYFLHWLATNVLTDGEVDKKASEILNSLYDDLKKL